MAISELAGKPAPQDLLTNVPRLVANYYALHPDPAEKNELVHFGTSGHRGDATEKTFNEDHILAICQAICEYRQRKGINGPLFLGMDTHALSEPAHITALEVLAANEVQVRYQAGMGYTPTPVVSFAILSYNRSRKSGLADGIVVTPSHNPPNDGGFKYNPPEGGPADVTTTTEIQERANQILEQGLSPVRRMPIERALKSDHVQAYDFMQPYIAELESVVDLQAVQKAGLQIGVDPMGGAAVHYWGPIAERYGLQIEVVNQKVDPTFSFMTVDWDGRIRMDCSSPYAMTRLIGLKDRFQIAFGNDPDVDRHGIVTRSVGLMKPNHYLAVAVWYLFTYRKAWKPQTQVGKTLVSSSMIDRVAASLGRKVCEVPVGFKWFVDGLLDGSFGFGGEESAGASFLRMDGTVWTTDKDGIIPNLLAAEILAVTGRDPGECYRDLEDRFGHSYYGRIQEPANAAQKEALNDLAPEAVQASELAGDPILARLTKAPGNGAPIGGLKVTTAEGWFAARPSGTEDVYKIYAESMRSEAHLKEIQEQAKQIVARAFKHAGA